MIFLHYADIRTYNVAVEIQIAGVPIFTSVTARAKSDIVPISGWLHPHENRVRVLISAAGPSPSAEITIRRMTVGALTNEGETRFHYTFPPADFEQKMLPVEFVAPYPVPPDDIRARLWRDAEALPTLSARDVADIAELVEKFRSLNIKKRWPELLSLLDYRIQEEARIEGHAPERLKAVYQQQFETHLGPGHIEISPIDWQITSLRSVYANQVVAITPQGAPTLPILRGQIENPADKTQTSFGIPVYVSRIAGVWRVVRGF